MDINIVEVPGLGRPFQLGMAYDLRKHKLLPGLTLWDQETLQNNIGVSNQCDTKFSLLTSDSSEDKKSTQKIDADLKIAAISRHVEFGGAFRYFAEDKKSENHAKLTLSYHATTTFRQLSMDHLTKISYPNELKRTGATHVVVAILYGADAYFVFERELDSSENKMEAEGKLKLAIQSLSFLKIGQAGFDNSGQVDGGDKQNFEKVSCTFHGDFKLSSNPCTFQDALGVYKQLPHLLGNNGEDAVPLQVWLYPLSKLPKAGAEVPVCNVSPISVGLNTSLEHAMDRLNTTEGKIEDLMDYEAAKAFPPFQSKLQDLRQQFSQHKARFMTSLADLLPLIRGKEKEESVLFDLLKAHEKSLFNSAAMDQWLKYRKMESEVLGSILDQLREIEVSLDDDLHLLLMESETERVVSFTFAFLDTPDPFLLDLAEQREANTAEVRTWLTGEVITAMRKNLKLFRDLKKSNNSSSTKFSSSSRMSLIFSHRGATEGPSHKETQPGASIVLYEVCSDDPVCFTPPSKPTLSVTRCTSNSITLELNCECEATEARILEYKPRREEEWETIEIRKDTVTLPNLKRGTEYEIRCTAMGENKYLPVISDVIKVRTSDAS